MFSSVSSSQFDIRAGDLVYSRLLGKDIIILNSENVAKELLENRSKNYSDRPYLITSKLLGLRFLSCCQPHSTTPGVDWNSFPFFCPMATDGDCTGAFSTRRSGPNRYTDFCPPSTARHVISSGGCSLHPNNSMIMYSSKCTRTNVMIDQTYVSIEIHGGGHHEQHI
jgi:hypothetical protein